MDRIMSVFRVEKTKNYTVMSNYHLKDKNLSLKTKGLLSIMLSLPEDWDYTEIGLTVITGEGRSAIRACLKQLEQFGYLKRSQTRDEKGRLAKSMYIIYEVPVEENPSPLFDFPTTDNPTSEKPTSDNPSSEKPSTGNRTQLNTNNKNTNKQNTNLSINLPKATSQADGSIDEYEAYRKLLEENTGLSVFRSKREQLEKRFETDDIGVEEYEQEAAEYDPNRAEKIIAYMLDIICSASTEDITINGNKIIREVVKSKLLKVDFLQMRAVVKELNSNQSIKNPKSYAISMLYNA